MNVAECDGHNVTLWLGHKRWKLTTQYVITWTALVNMFMIEPIINWIEQLTFFNFTSEMPKKMCVYGNPTPSPKP